METNDADLTRARSLASAANALAIAGALPLALLCIIAARAFESVPVVTPLLLFIRLSAKETGRHRATAILGYAIPTAVAIGLFFWVLLGSGHQRESEVFLVAVIATLLIVVLLTAATVCAAAVPSGTIPPDLKPGSSVLVHHADGRYYPGRAGPVQNGYVYVYFNPGAGDWVPRQYVRVKAG